MAGGTPGFFDVDDRLAELSAKGDDLERVNALVDFEMIRPALQAAVARANTAAEKQAIREGRIPEGWEEKPAKLAPKGSRRALDDQIHQGQGEG
jgi:hypothetical protein